LGRDLTLEAAEHERTNTLAQSHCRLGIACGDRPHVAVSKIGATPEQSPIEEVKLTPEIVEAILDGRAREGQAELGFEAVSRASGLALGILDRLRLIEHDDVPWLFGQPVDVEPKD